MKLFRRQRASLCICPEMIFLGAVALMIGLIKFWIFIFLPPSIDNESGMFTGMLMTSSLLDLACIVAAGIFFIRAFRVQDGFEKRKKRITDFALNALILFLVIAVNYILLLIIDYLFSSYDRMPVLLPSYIGFFFTIVCALLLQGEVIADIWSRRKSLLIRMELIFLAVVAMLFAMLPIWLFGIFVDSEFASSSLLDTLIESVRGNSLWKTAYAFAAAWLFVGAFHIKMDQSTAANVQHEGQDVGL